MNARRVAVSARALQVAAIAVVGAVLIAILFWLAASRGPEPDARTVTAVPFYYERILIDMGEKQCGGFEPVYQARYVGERKCAVAGYLKPLQGGRWRVATDRANQGPFFDVRPGALIKTSMPRIGRAVAECPDHTSASTQAADDCLDTPSRVGSRRYMRVQQQDASERPCRASQNCRGVTIARGVPESPQATQGTV